MNSGICAFCGGKVKRFRKRNGEPYKYCSPECDKANLSYRISHRPISNKPTEKNPVAIDYAAVLTDLNNKKLALENTIRDLDAAIKLFMPYMKL